MNLYFTSQNAISISGNISSACILRGIFICIAVFSVNTHLWSSHNIIEDFQILRLEQIPVQLLLIFFSNILHYFQCVGVFDTRVV